MDINECIEISFIRTSLLNSFIREAIKGGFLSEIDVLEILSKLDIHLKDYKSGGN